MGRALTPLYCPPAQERRAGLQPAVCYPADYAGVNGYFGLRWPTSTCQMNPTRYGLGSGISLLLLTLLKASFYLAIRRGMLRAKVVVLVVCAYIAYADTHPHHGYFVGVYVR